jgi:hypothetical protein
MAETRDVVRTGSAGARKEGGPAYLAVHRLEAWAQAAEHLVAQTFDFPEGVIFGDPGRSWPQTAARARFLPRTSFSIQSGTLVPDFFSVFHQPARALA